MSDKNIFNGVDFTPAIKAGAQSFYKIFKAHIQHKKDVADAFAFLAKEMADIEAGLVDGTFSESEAKLLIANAKLAVHASLASAAGKKQAEVANAGNDAINAFLKIAEVALANAIKAM